MNEVILHFHFFSFEVFVTTWKLIGYTGGVLFTGRWAVQLIASRAAGRPVIPRAFWILSVLGSLMQLSYFIAGKNDSVGVLSNLFPTFTACYSLWLDLRTRKPVVKDFV
jgi:lipid-A-disaccharide synthase-like uncharacterized protein